MTETPK